MFMECCAAHSSWSGKQRRTHVIALRCMRCTSSEFCDEQHLEWQVPKKAGRVPRLPAPRISKTFCPKIGDRMFASPSGGITNQPEGLGRIQLVSKWSYHGGTSAGPRLLRSLAAIVVGLFVCGLIVNQLGTFGHTRHLIATDEVLLHPHSVSIIQSYEVAIITQTCVRGS